MQSPLKLVLPPLEWVLPPLEGALFGVPLGLPKLVMICLGLWCLIFSIAILVDNLLTFCNASAISLPAGMFPWSAILSCCAAVLTWDSGENVGFVMYWCLKKTASLPVICDIHPETPVMFH